MFLKPYKVKSNVPLNSSKVKSLRQRIFEEFPNTNTKLLIPPKSKVNVLKLVTHGDLHINVYCADKLPMFFESNENKLVPTLYSLWQVSDMLPYFTTHAAVLPKLSNGADLMLPGVIPQGTGMNMYGHFRKGQLVSINLASNKSAVGVGYLPRSSDDLYMSGGHGVAVKVLHLFGDKLWGHEPSLAQQVPQLPTTKLTSDDFPVLEKEINKKQKETRVKQESEVFDEIKNLTITNKEIEIASNDIESNELDINEMNSRQNSPEMLLKHAFLSALKNHGKTLQLPLLTSNFFRLYMVPEAREPLDLKKTKYKKLSNFLNEMIDQGFIVVREETKGIDKITFIDMDHPEIVNFITDSKSPESKDNSSRNPLFYSELTEVLTVTDATAPFFTTMNYNRGSVIPSSQIKKIIKEYINRQSLAISKDSQAEDKTYILDNCLEKVCNSKVASLNKIVNAVVSQMDHSYQMCYVKDVKNNKPMIQMSLATRSGNKKVTLLSNIECYGIIMTEFIKLCKQGAAASQTIVTLPNQSREIFQIQGNQIQFLYNLLTETYKIPPKCIMGLELAKNRKRRKIKCVKNVHKS